MPDYFHTHGDYVRACNPYNDSSLRHIDGKLGKVVGRYYNGRSCRYTVRIGDRDYDLAESELVKGQKPCPGAAHSNAHIDNCALCAPGWDE